MFKTNQGLYRDIQSSSGTKQIEYYDVLLNQFSAASHSYTGHDSCVLETSLPCMSCPYIVRMGELIAEMKNSAESEDKTDMAVGSPKMNSTQESGCDNY